MASKGSVRERAYRGAKPDSARCNGQLELEARFKHPPGQSSMSISADKFISVKSTFISKRAYGAR